MSKKMKRAAREEVEAEVEVATEVAVEAAESTEAPVEAAAPKAAPEPTVTLTSSQLQEMIAKAAAAAAMAVQAERVPEHLIATKAPLRDLGPECEKCGQRIKVCKDQHVMMVVFPANRRLARYFQGLKLNGVTYHSGQPGRPIWVPATNDFAYQLQQFGENEENFLHGRSASHNSGTIGPSGGNQFVPAHVPQWDGVQQ
jgi:enamine deaminase RidA (YjgF/YER057c/UK114 family)